MSDLEKKPEGAVPPVQGAPVPPQTAAAMAQPAPAGQPSAQAAPAECTVTLKHPFKAGDRSVTSVSFARRPVARDLVRQFPDATTAEERELHGIAVLLGVNPEDLMEMDGYDYLAVQKKWAAFLA